MSTRRLPMATYPQAYISTRIMRSSVSMRLIRQLTKLMPRQSLVRQQPIRQMHQLSVNTSIPINIQSHATKLPTLAVGAYDDKYISVIINGEHILQFSNIFLRDSCQAPDSVDPYSKQKLFTTAEISKNLRLNAPPFVKNGVLHVQWNQNGQIHNSEYTERFLKISSNTTSRRRGKNFELEKTFWNEKQLRAEFPALNVSYDEYMKDQDVFDHTVNNLNQYGIAFVNNIENVQIDKKMSEENAPSWPVAKLASKFGYIKKTFYGSLFDVKNEKEAKNIANTSSFLPLHMDLLYYESPPGLQLLHFIQNSTTGGENIFCDSFLAAEHVREVDPQAYFALTEVPITYHYDNNNEYYYFQRPLVVEGEVVDSRTNYPVIKEVNYSPPFQGPFEVGITKNNSFSTSSNLDVLNTSAMENSSHFLFQDFIRGFQLFEDFINDPKNHFQIKSKENSCVIFDNRRVLHSRLQFSDANGGDRWLMGCYVDGDSFRSKLRVSHRKNLVKK